MIVKKEERPADAECRYSVAGASGKGGVGQGANEEVRC